MTHAFHVQFEHEGSNYRLAALCSAYAGSAGLGCHITAYSGLGTIALTGISKIVDTEYLDWWGQKQTTTTDIPLRSVSDGWGIYNNIYEPVAKRFGGREDELRDLLYRPIAAEYSKSAAGCILFSEPVNRDTASRAGHARIVPDLNFTTGPAPFFKWLSDHPEYGPCWASPVFGNPNHRSRTDFSIAQVFMWVPEVNAWTVATDWGIPKIQPAANEDFISDNLVSGFAKLHGISKEKASEELKVTYL